MICLILEQNFILTPLQSVYKADLEWLRGIGWMPEGSVEMNRVKVAQDLINERLYRTRPEALTFTSIVDTPEVVLAKANSLQMSEVGTIQSPSFPFAGLYFQMMPLRPSKWAAPLQRRTDGSNSKNLLMVGRGHMPGSVLTAVSVPFCYHTPTL